MDTTIRDLADALVRELTDVTISGMDTATVAALGKLTDVVGRYSLRQELAARRRTLWFESAITDPPSDALTRTVIVGRPANPDWACAVLVQRTDTGQHYVVSTSEAKEETFVWRANADGYRYPHPKVDDCAEDIVYQVSGRGMTRAESILAIDRADTSTLVAGLPSYDYDK